MLDPPPPYRANRADKLAGQLIHALWGVTHRHAGSLENATRSDSIPGWTAQGNDPVAVAVDGPIQVPRRPSDLNVGFAYMPRAPRRAMTSCPPVITQPGGE